MVVAVPGALGGWIRFTIFAIVGFSRPFFIIRVVCAFDGFHGLAEIYEFGDYDYPVLLEIILLL